MSVESLPIRTAEGGNGAKGPRKICLCEQNAALRETVRQVLAAEQGLHVVVEATTGTECLADVLKLRPDVAVLDVRMPDMGGLELAEELHRTAPQTKVVVLLTEDAPGYHDAAAQQGAICVAKDHLLERLPTAIASSQGKVTPVADPPSDPTAGVANMNTYLDGRAVRVEAQPRKRTAVTSVDVIACLKPVLAILLIGTLLLGCAAWLVGQAQVAAVEASVIPASDGSAYVVDEAGLVGKSGELVHLSASQRQAYVRQLIDVRQANLAFTTRLGFLGLFVSSLLIGCIQVKERMRDAAVT